MELEQLTSVVIGAAMRVHSALGPGFLESVYQKALAYELQKNGLHVECECSIAVHYESVLVGEFCADMIIGHCLLIENKAVQTLAPIHEVQVVNYLTATGLEVGLLLNFGAARLEFKRKCRELKPKQRGG